MKRNYLILFALILLITSGYGQISIPVFEDTYPNTKPDIQAPNLFSDKNCSFRPYYYYWTGEEDNDFFNENNWRTAYQIPQIPYPRFDTRENYEIVIGNHNPFRDRHPRSGSIDPGKPIEVNLYMKGANLDIYDKLNFSCDSRGITLAESKINFYTSGNQGVVSLTDESTINLNYKIETSSRFKFNIIDGESWIYLQQNHPVELESIEVGKILINKNPAIINGNVKFDQYYQKGSLIRQNTSDYKPLTVYEGSYLSGTSSALKARDIYSGATIPGGLDNAISSFKLKRGYQVTVAIQENGTSMSKVYIANEEDLIINNLPAALDNNVSFIRVLPWEWIVKKGTGGYHNYLNAGWYYNWGNGSETEANYKYVPMAWGAGAASTTGVNRVIDKLDVNHLLAFNESDNCNDQSGQFSNLCEPAVAVAYYENLMSTGMRLGTPAPRENGPFGWLSEFSRIAKEKDIRFDFVAVHWYDWASGPQNSPNASANAIFNRFKTYLKNVHDKYDLPIWITEFNANPNRTNSIQDEFLRLALPYLESLDYVERYAYFQPNPNNSANPIESAFYRDDQDNLTNIGQLYLDHNSTPSIPELSYASPNNLEGLDQPFEEKDPVILAYEAECVPIIGNQLVVVEDENASNGYYLELDTDLQGETALARQINFDIDVTEDDSFRIWLRYKSSNGTNTGVKVYIDEKETPENLGGLNSAAFEWERLARFFELKAGTHRITIEYNNNKFLFDELALINGSGSVDLIPQSAETCVPPTERWGAAKTDITYFIEAESSILGKAWAVGNSAKAINGSYIYASQSALDVPPADSGYANFNFDIAEADRYEIWGKVQALADNADAFWVKVDDGEFKLWDNLKSDLYLWFWQRLHTSTESGNTGFSYFLEAGNHQVTIAYNEADTKIDRIAVSSFGKSPADEDPNVLFPDSSLEFEAEDAIFIGNQVVQDCSSSSNGQQVRPNPFNNNRIRFEGIGVPQAGIYTLQISYMSKNIRNFGLRVNEVNLGNRPIPSSGLWCFEDGVPAIYEVEIELIAGENVIELTGAVNDAPFFDKIAIIKKSAYEMEAEDAILIGNNTVANCSNSSNGQQVRPNPSDTNRIRFEDIAIPQAGAYTVQIHYMSKNERNFGIRLNEENLGNFQMPSSGLWCFEDGIPGVYEVNLDLVAGNNVIELTGAANDAPFFDKIVIVENVNAVQKQSIKNKVQTATAATVTEPLDSFNIDSVFLYPNPIRQSEALHIVLPKEMGNQLTIDVLDITGRVVYNKGKQDYTANSNLQLETSNLKTGMYLIRFSNDSKSVTKKLLVK